MKKIGQVWWAMVWVKQPGVGTTFLTFLVGLGVVVARKIAKTAAIEWVWWAMVSVKQPGVGTTFLTFFCGAGGGGGDGLG